jgi:hypothetical protein
MQMPFHQRGERGFRTVSGELAQKFKIIHRANL